jgi:predicted AlkP superfamily pyrophosphatase or phosphodiesterase
MRRRLLVLISCATAALVWLAPAFPAAQTPPGPPRLIVLVVVDQMRADYLEKYDAQITGGFRRLLTDGAVFSQAYYPYASTETAQGHATMLTGQPPSASGIVGDTWYDRPSKATILAGDSANHKLIEGAPRGGSPEQLLVHTLGDAMKERDPRTLVITASWKRYAAILMGGQHADAAYWFDSPSGHMVTSDYYQRAYPAWVEAFNSADPTAKYFGQTWLGHSFGPAASAPTPAFRDALRLSPYTNDLLLQFATMMLSGSQLGRDNVPDIMAISFSALDYVGHAYGPETPEFDETFRQMDRQVGALMQALDERVGRGAWTLALVADHGAALLPEKMKERGQDAGRLDIRAVTDAIVKELSVKWPDANRLIASIEAPEYYLDYAEAARRGIKANELEDAFADAARKQPGIAEVYTRTQIMAAGASSDPHLLAVAAGFHIARSGDIFMVQKPNYIFWGASGTTHGSPYEYDQHVPLIFLGSGIAKGTRADHVLITDLAPTLAGIAGVDLPGVAGHALPGVRTGAVPR